MNAANVGKRHYKSVVGLRASSVLIIHGNNEAVWTQKCVQIWLKYLNNFDRETQASPPKTLQETTGKCRIGLYRTKI